MATDENIHILNTNNPDKDIEYFWITFKMCCKKIVNRAILIMFDKLSTDLNLYQQREDFKRIYEDIDLFITENINYIICDVINNGDIQDAKNVHLCIMRWKRISPSFDLSTLEYDLLRIIKNLNEENDSIRTHIKNYIQDSSEIKLISLFELAIREKFVCLIDVLKKYVDIHTYIDCKMNETVNFLVGRNLIQFLKME
jgi:hypothetical protein